MLFCSWVPRRSAKLGGIKSKSWTTASGRVIGDTPFSRGALYLMLQNRLYRGEIARSRDLTPVNET
jgi:hypothetical protein